MKKTIIQFIFSVSLVLLIIFPVHSVPILSPSREALDADLERVRERVIKDLLAPEIKEPEVERLIQIRDNNGTWPDINYEDVSRTGFEHSQHLINMLVLATAYKKPGSPYFHEAEVKEAVSSALDFWLEHDFISDNWWWNEMGTPGQIVSTPPSTCFPLIIYALALEKNKDYGKKREDGAADGGICRQRTDPERVQCLQRNGFPYIQLLVQKT